MDRSTHNVGGGKDEKDVSVKVICRFRPQNPSEIATGGTEVMHFHGDDSVEIRVSVRPPEQQRPAHYCKLCDDGFPARIGAVRHVLMFLVA